MLERMIKEIAALVNRDHPGRALLMVSGVDGSGKTSFASALRDALAASGRHALVVSIDSFHNSRDIRYRRGALSAEGYYRDSFQSDVFENEVLRPFSAGAGRISTRAWDLQGNRPDRRDTEAGEDSVLIAEGVFLLRREWMRYADLSLFLDVRFRTVLERVVVRDSREPGDEHAVRERYLKKYIPGQILYLREHRPRQLADIVIDNNDFNRPFFRKRV